MVSQSSEPLWTSGTGLKAWCTCRSSHTAGGVQSRIVQKKDKVKVKVLKVDPETGKVSLSIKQTKPHPWETIEEDYPVGRIVEGTVIRILTFGAIIELSEGVTGLLHISQISNDKIPEGRGCVEGGRRHQGQGSRSAQGGTQGQAQHERR